jgi:aspartate racemase
MINDRTKYLQDSSKDNPGPAMARLILSSIAPFPDSVPVIGVPCNTFHAPAIFNPFCAEIEHRRSDAYIIHMPDQTVIHIKNSSASVKRIGILTTTGTRKSGLWRSLLEKHGYTVIEVPEAMQKELHASIYDREYGLKAVSPASGKARNNFALYSRILKDEGAEAIITGCTEIPLAFTSDRFEELPLVNPIRALARGMIEAAVPEKLKPHQ